MPGKRSSDSDMNFSDNESKIIGRCLDEGHCLHSLQIIVDGEASSEEETYFLEHIMDCLPCYQRYHLEKSVKEIIKNKIEKKRVPQSLLTNIRVQIKNIKETA